MNETKCPDVNLLAAEIHANAVQHGFWENYSSPEHYLCLVACELAELVEANRQERKADKTAFVERVNEIPSPHEAATFEQRYAYWFEACIKDTMEDELADAVIRLLDLAAAKGITIDELCPKYNCIGSFDTLTEDVWVIMGIVTESPASLHVVIHKALTSLQDLADQWEIDLWWHVLAKMEYNAHRPYKHGKKY